MPVRHGRRSGPDATTHTAVACCLLVVALAGCSRSTAAGTARPAGSNGGAYTLMQMNLCLSGIAGCYAKVAYPAGVDEAAALIRAAHPDAVTLSEACRGDVSRIAARTGYHLRFATVIYGGRPFECIDPRGRGRFGDAVLTRTAVVHTDNHAFAAQADIERRRWLCVTARGGVDVCTAHLATRDALEVAANDAECAELAAILARRPAATVIFGGDVNRRGSCAPPGSWIRTDASAAQAPGLQQVYGRGALRSPSAAVVPFAHSDHDALLVRARIVR